MLNKLKKYLKNKFIFASVLFLIYVLFLDDVDIFAIISQNRKLHKLEAATVETQQKLNQTRAVLKKLKYKSELETYAREEKLFKKDDEDVFVISYE